MNSSVILTDFGAVVGVALLLVMALAPFFTDRHRPLSESPLKQAVDTRVVIPVQRGARLRVPPATRPARPHAAPR
jgi:hypothetical protein